jgi:hypothetical protein
VQAKVRHGLLHLTLDVPDSDLLLDWAHVAHKPLSGHVTFFEPDQRTARETLSFAAGQCVSYQETFVAGEGTAGAYVCQLTLTSDGLSMAPGGPASPFVAPAARGYAAPVGAALLPLGMKKRPVLFRDSTWGVEPATPELVQKVMQRRRVITALPGTDDLAYLDNPLIMAEASCNDEDYQHIILRENPSKTALLEEFLHGTQHKLGIIDKLGRGGAEYHVKDFMIRHQKLLGLGAEDVEILQKLMESGL